MFMSHYATEVCKCPVTWALDEFFINPEFVGSFIASTTKRNNVVVTVAAANLNNMCTY